MIQRKPSVNDDKAADDGRSVDKPQMQKGHQREPKLNKGETETNIKEKDNINIFEKDAPKESKGHNYIPICWEETQNQEYRAYGEEGKINSEIEEECNHDHDMNLRPTIKRVAELPWIK